MSRITEKKISAALLLFCVTIPALAQIKAPGYKVETLVKPSHFHGIHGLAFDAQDRLYAGSVSGQTLYRVDKKTGSVETVVAPPEGMADDLLFLPDGTMVWTSISQGTVRARTGDGPVRVLAEKIPSVNSIAYRKSDGRLFVAQVFGGDGLWELDPTGTKPPRNILKDIGGLNGFDIGPDGWIYGPLWFKHQVVKINPDTGELIVLTDKFTIPAAANFDSKWNLYVLDTALGRVMRVDIKSGETSLIAQLEPSLDNLAIDSQDRLYVSNMADNGIQEVDVKTGKPRQVIKGKFAALRGIAATGEAGKEKLYATDMFAFRTVDVKSGDVTTVDRVFASDAKIDYTSGLSANREHVTLVTGGNIQTYDAKTGALLSQIGDMRGTAQAVEMPNGNLLVAQTNGTLLQIDRTNGAKKVLAEKLSRPNSLAIATDKLVYVNEMTGNRVSAVDLETGAMKIVIGDLQTPQSIALTKSGALLVLEYGKRRILRVNVSNGAIEEVATNLPIGLLNGPIPATNALAVGMDDAIYVTSDIENSIHKITKR
jgi:sugar lactone lactonase YvrE